MIPQSTVSNSPTTTEKQIMRKPSPLRLQPVDQAPISKKTRSDAPVEPIALPPAVASPDTSLHRTTSHNLQPVLKTDTVVAPELSPAESRPTSFLPRISFSGSLRDNLVSSLLVSSKSVKSRNSHRASSVAQPPLSAVTEVSMQSPIIPIPPKSALRERRTLWPREDLGRPKARKPSGYHVVSPSLELEMKKQSEVTTVVSTILESPFSKSRDDSTRYATRRKSSDVVSLAALTGTPIESYFPTQPLPVSQSSQTSSQLPKTIQDVEAASTNARRSGSTPPVHSRQSSRSLARARNSVQYTANSSRTRSTSASNRRSRERDSMHYDPSSHHRNPSGSILGRPIDFCNPRETPFSDRNAYDAPVKGHTQQNSNSSESTLSSYYTTTRSERSSRTSHFDSTIAEELTGKGSRLRTTMDPFGTKDLNPFADVPSMPEVTSQSRPRSSTMNQMLSNSLNRVQEQENLRRSGTVSVAKVERRKPQRVSSHGEEWSVDVRPGFAKIETGSTSSSPIVGSPNVQERFPGYVRL